MERKLRPLDTLPLCMRAAWCVLEVYMVDWTAITEALVLLLGLSVL